jgi:hypothetical protein
MKSCRQNGLISLCLLGTIVFWTPKQIISATKITQKSDLALSTLLSFEQDSGVEPGDDDVFAYSSVVADGENISKIKHEARAQAAPKPPPKAKEEKFDEDSAIVDYSMTLADSEKGGDESGGISLAEKMLSNKK